MSKSKIEILAQKIAEVYQQQSKANLKRNDDYDPVDVDSDIYFNTHRARFLKMAESYLECKSTDMVSKGKALCAGLLNSIKEGTPEEVVRLHLHQTDYFFEMAIAIRELL
jgi:hypothetical protein